MKRANISTFLLIAVILSALASSAWLTFLQIKEYGITLVFAGNELVIDGKEVCKDVVGSVIIKFGNEFQSVDVCELIEEKAVYVSFSEGVKYWMGTLEESGAMPTVSVTFWLITEDIHYIANDMFTSLDYYMSLGYSYIDAYYKMLKDPLAIVRERGTIVIRSDELVRKLVPVNMTRAIEGIRRGLGLEMTPSSGNVSARGSCPPGTALVDTGVCKWENYWGLPDTAPQWFYNRTIALSDDKNEVVRRLWDNFREYFGTAYLVRKDLYPSEESAMSRLLRVWSNPCFRYWGGLGKPIDMSKLLKACLYGSSYQVSWNYTRAPLSEFIMYKLFVIMVELSTSEIPLIEIRLEYGAFPFKRTGFSIMGVVIYGSKGSVGSGMELVRFSNWWWSEYGARSAAIIIPTRMKYFFDALIFTWNMRSFYDPHYGSFWLFEPVPVITPYYEEVGLAPDDRWRDTYYDQDGNCVFGCEYPQNVYDLIEEATGTLSRDYYLIYSTRVNDLACNRALDTSIIEDISIIDRKSVGYTDSLGSHLFGIAKSVVADLFFGDISGHFAKLLGLIEYTDTTFSASAVIQNLGCFRFRGAQGDIWVEMWKGTKNATYLSDYYDLINRRPLVAVYVIRFYTSTEGGP